MESFYLAAPFCCLNIRFQDMEYIYAIRDIIHCLTSNYSLLAFNCDAIMSLRGTNALKFVLVFLGYLVLFPSDGFIHGWIAALLFLMFYPGKC